jgi:hypothetical protein
MATQQTTQTTYDTQERQALRANYHVRTLTPEEEGTGVAWLPDGVYGFTSSVMQRDAPLYGRPICQSYEVHKLADGTVRIVGYVTPEDAAKLGASQSFVTIYLCPAPQGGADTLVSIPVARVLRHKEHSQRMEGGVQLEVEAGA